MDLKLSGDRDPLARLLTSYILILVYHLRTKYAII